MPAIPNWAFYGRSASLFDPWGVFRGAPYVLSVVPAGSVVPQGGNCGGHGIFTSHPHVFNFQATVTRPLDTAGVPIESPVLIPPEVFPGLLPATGQLLIVGETNIGKSLLALELASAMLTGEPLWTALHPHWKATKVLYVLGEHHTSTLQGLWAKTGLVAPPRALWVVGPHEFPDHHLVIRGAPQLTVATQLQECVKGCGLVIFDPLASFVRGENVENDNAQMRLVVDTLTGIANNAGAACVILAHSGKPRQGEDGQPIQRGEYRVRGASSVEDAAHAVFYMDKGMDGFYRLSRRKYKGTQEPAHYLLVRDPSTLRHTLVTSPHDAKRLDFIQRLRHLETMMPPDDALTTLLGATGTAPDTAKIWLSA